MIYTSFDCIVKFSCLPRGRRLKAKPRKSLVFLCVLDLVAGEGGSPLLPHCPMAEEEVEDWICFFSVLLQNPVEVKKKVVLGLFPGWVQSRST